MKSMVALGMMTLIAASTGAMAGDHDRDHGKIFRVDLVCKFSDEKPKNAGVPDDHDDKDKCFAAAKIFIDKDGRDECSLEGDDYDGRFKNLFSVLCDGKLVYADGAFVKYEHDKVVIKGKGEHAPALILLKDDYESADRWAGINAILKLDRKDDKLRGFCKVRKVPVYRSGEEIPASILQ